MQVAGRVTKRTRKSKMTQPYFYVSFFLKRQTTSTDYSVSVGIVTENLFDQKISGNIPGTVIPYDLVCPPDGLSVNIS